MVSAKKVDMREARAERKRRTLQAKQQCSAVTDANKVDHPLDQLADGFKMFSRNGLNLKLDCRRASAFSHSDRDWVFDLTKRNMLILYQQSEGGWSDEEKRTELTDEEAYYVIARDSNDRPVAFSHFRFDFDHGETVLYCYELQVEEAYQRKGVGKWLTQVLELISFKHGMSKVVLTAFKDNSAVRFYRQLRYTEDSTNPVEEEGCDYLILSKSTVPERLRR